MITGISPKQDVPFKAKMNAYKLDRLTIYPISRKPDAREICDVFSAQNRELIGSGKSGYVYKLYDNVVKVFKSLQSEAQAKWGFENEAANLFDLNAISLKHNNPNYFHNTQKGIFGLSVDNNNFLMSTKVPGEIPYPDRAPFNKDNLEALVEIFARLDKGDENLRYLHPDLNSSNMMITGKSAGLLDFGLATSLELKSNKNITGSGQQFIKNQFDKFLMQFSGDTGYGTSNLRAFENDCFAPYLYSCKTFSQAKEALRDYLPLKSNYHADMAKHYEKLSKIKGDDIFKRMAVEENIHAYLLYKDNLAPDIIHTEVDKLQMGFFLRAINMLNDGQNVRHFNLTSVDSFLAQCKSNYNILYKNAVTKNDIPRICYYNNANTQLECVTALIQDTAKNIDVPSEKLFSETVFGLLHQKLF